MATTTRFLLQATYTPIKIPESEDAPAMPGTELESGPGTDPSSSSEEGEQGHEPSRGIEKCAVLRHLKPSLDELKQIASEASELRYLVDVLTGLAKGDPRECAKTLAAVDFSLILRFADCLIRIREEQLARVREAAELPTLRAYRLPREQIPSAQAVLVKAKKAASGQALSSAAAQGLAKALRIELAEIKIVDLLPVMTGLVRKQALLVAGVKDAIKVEPIGYLHLERLAFTPVSTERGELVHSIPLAPGEQINVAHREWSNTSEEFESIVNDSLEEFSEEGVTEKSELSQSVDSQEQHSTAFNTGVTASGGYGPVTITSTVGHNASNSASRSESQARNHSSSITQKSSSRAKQEHKVSFRVASASEVEDQRVQRIENPYKRRAARVDYYQLIRKWKVDLYRYGVRLTWDLTIPEPGSALLSKMREIERIRDELENGFDALFTLTPADLTRAEYPDKAAHYGVAVEEAPPPADRVVAYTDSKSTLSQEKYVFDFDVPEDYQVKSATLDYFENHRTASWGIQIQDVSGLHVNLFSRGSSWAEEERNNYTGWNGRSGKLFVHVNLWNIKFYVMTIKLVCELQESAFVEWQQRTWEAIRAEFHTAYLERRQMLSDRLERVERELGTQDALSLRKLEREEVMKGLLRWIGISDFRFFPEGVASEIEQELYDADTGLVEDQDLSAKMLAQGEVIKFLHHAIEWENMIYFLYPYFWTHALRWQFKMHLDHPDSLHRAFLKAGSARVVLTIRPGFEDAFMAFLNTGDFNEMPPSPYLEIGEELRRFAQTNYPGIPPANPIENIRPLLYPEQRRAWEDIEVITQLLEEYADSNNGTYPTTNEGLSVLGTGVPASDPWGNEYHYRNPGQHGRYDLYSLGADGQVGGDGLDADITSWAEASHIGQWYEYTPTTALDITFNGPLPGGSGEPPSEDARIPENLLRSTIDFLNSGTTAAKIIKWAAFVISVLGIAYFGLDMLGVT